MFIIDGGQIGGVSQCFIFLSNLRVISENNSGINCKAAIMYCFLLQNNILINYVQMIYH